MNKPAAPPDAVLIRLVREARDMTTADTARKAGISAVRLTQIENGCETRAGQIKPVHAKPGTIARVAHALGIPPERLEEEGHRPDAVPILREILRNEEAARSETGGEQAPGPEPEPARPASPAVTSAISALVEYYVPEVQAEISRARMRNPDVTGTGIFTDRFEVAMFDLFDPDIFRLPDSALKQRRRTQCFKYIAGLRAQRAAEETQNTGFPGPPSLLTAGP